MASQAQGNLADSLRDGSDKPGLPFSGTLGGLAAYRSLLLWLHQGVLQSIRLCV
jgi:hypothetical protein